MLVVHWNSDPDQKGYEMSVLTLEGVVEDGKVRLTDSEVLPEKQKVYVVVPDMRIQRAGIHSPRLADPKQIADFTLEMTELPEADAEL